MFHHLKPKTILLVPWYNSVLFGFMSAGWRSSHHRRCPLIGAERTHNTGVTQLYFLTLLSTSACSNISWRLQDAYKNLTSVCLCPLLSSDRHQHVLKCLAEMGPKRITASLFVLKLVSFMRSSVWGRRLGAVHIGHQKKKPSVKKSISSLQFWSLYVQNKVATIKQEQHPLFCFVAGIQCCQMIPYNNTSTLEYRIKVMMF